MWGIAFSDVIVGWLRRLAKPALLLLAGAGFLFMFYLWAYDRGRDAERARWEESARRLTAAAYKLMDAIDERLAADMDEIRRARSAAAAVTRRSKDERDAFYANPANPNFLCLTPARVVRREAALAALADSSGGAGRDRDELPSRAEAAGQGGGRQPEVERGRGDD